MKKEIISDKQGINITTLFLFGSTLIMGTGGESKNSLWLAIILGLILAVPIVMVYGRISYRYPGRDLYDILQEVFGKITGKALSMIFIWFSFHLGSLVLRNFGEFMSTVGLPETPKIVPIIIFSLVCALGVKYGIEVIAKCSCFFIIIVISLLILFIILTIPNMEPENLLPIMGNGLAPILKGAFSVFTFPFGELVVFLLVFDSLSKPESAMKVYLKALFFGGFFIAFVGLRNVMVIGESIDNVYFPSYSAVSRINIGNFIQRLEVSVIIIFILSGFIKISICLLSSAKGLAKLFEFKDYRFLVIPVSLLMINLSDILFDNTMEMSEWSQEVWPYYAFPFQVILPIVILIAIEVKERFKKNKIRSEQNSDT